MHLNLSVLALPCAMDVGWVLLLIRLGKWFCKDNVWLGSGIIDLIINTTNLSQLNYYQIWMVKIFSPFLGLILLALAVFLYYLYLAYHSKLAERARRKQLVEKEMDEQWMISNHDTVKAVGGGVINNFKSLCWSHCLIFCFRGQSSLFCVFKYFYDIVIFYPPPPTNPSISFI